MCCHLKIAVNRVAEAKKGMFISLFDEQLYGQSRQDGQSIFVIRFLPLL